jgi:8-oxo-dGTP pyrophosphatase MutT (NUDIX family)
MIESKQTLHKIVSAYEKTFGADPSTESFWVFYKNFDDLVSRQNLVGHITGSAVVYDKSRNLALRVYNPKLRIWVYSAGGHVDAGEKPWEAATRELAEEVGIHADFFRYGSPDAFVPISFGAHPIEASVKKGEPAHWHYDLVYLYVVDHAPKLVLDPREVSNYKWVPPTEVVPPSVPVDLAAHMKAIGAL